MQTGTKRIARELVTFSLPLIFSGVLQQLYNWADAFIVGNVVGELALAAVGATTSVTNFYLTVITGFTLGLAVLFGQKSGAGETEDIPRILATFSLVMGAVFLVLAGIGAAMTPTLLRLMDTTADTIHLAEDYLRIVFIGIPFLAVYNVYAAALRGVGDSRTPFLSVLVSSVVNVVLDLVFVALLGWGVAGAAIATVLAQAAMTVFLVAYGAGKHPALRISLRSQPLSGTMLAAGGKLGVPPMLQSSVSAVGNLLLQGFMNGFGTQTVAAITTAYRVDCIILLPIINLGSGISTMVARSCGAGDRRRAGKVFSVGMGLMAAVCLVLTGLVIWLGGDLIAMFGVGAEATDIGRRFFRRIAAFYLVFGWATAARSYLEGQGKVLYASVTGILALATRIGLSYALKPIWGNMVIAYAEAISWILLLILNLVPALWQAQKEKHP